MYKQTYVYVSQEHQILHIKESHTNGKYAQENHMVLWVCIGRREQREGQRRLSEKEWSSWEPMEEQL